MACAEIRDVLRINVAETRQASREKVLVNKRKSLQDVLNIGRNVTKSEVVMIGNKLKSKSVVQLNDLSLLKIAFVQNDKNIAAFLKVNCALHCLVRELSSNKADFQLVAAECICNLALGDEWACLQVTKAAAPYLLALLNGCNYNLMSVSVWALGNLAGNGEKTWKILQAQGLLGKLLKLIVDFDTVPDNQARAQVYQNSLLAMVQLLYVGVKLFTDEEIKSIAKTLEQLTNTSNKGFRVSEYLLSCLEAAEEELIERMVVVKCLQFMVATELDDETISLFTPSVRTIANLITEPSGVCCSQVFSHWKLVQDTMQKILSSPYPHLISELGWLMGNLQKHPQSQQSLQEFAFDLQIFESQFAFFNHG